MSALVLGPITAVAEGLGAQGVHAHVGALPRVRTHVNLQVLQPREGFAAPAVLGGGHTNHINTVIIIYY